MTDAVLAAIPIETHRRLDAIDRKILTVLQDDASLSVAEGQPLEDAMRFASATAALKCTRFGGAFASPQRIEVDALLASSTVALTV